MKKILVYCHGYGSSANSDKVDRLRSAGFEVYAWDINPDPDVGLPMTADHVYNMVMDNLNRDVDLIFIGTSLGAWYAAKLAEDFGCEAVLVNPAHDPAFLLPEIGCDPTIAYKYDRMSFELNHTVFIASNDELISFDCVNFGRAALVETATGGHRYNGPEFDAVIEYIRNM